MTFSSCDPCDNVTAVFWTRTRSQNMVPQTAMFAYNDGLRSGSQRPSSINMSKIGNSDTLQSHLSVPSSSKRLRAPPGSLSLVSNQNDVDPSKQHTLSVKRADLWGNPVIAQEPSALDVSGTIRSTSSVRTRIQLVARYALIFYCFVSCIVATIRLYVFCSSTNTVRWDTQPVNDKSPTVETVNSMTGYLTKAIPGSTYFEPDVLSNRVQNDSVSLVGWLADSEMDLIRTWMRHWPGLFAFSPCLLFSDES